jgi:2-dehydro-3-deoxy-D-gluconate 5-dehydrogenase
MGSIAAAAAQTPNVSALDLFSLKGKNVLITGGSRGIGAAMAVALAQAGASVCIAQSKTSNTSTADSIRDLGVKAEIIACNLKKVEDAKEIFPKALEVMDGRIDILVNCAGLLQRKDSVDITEEDWDNVSVISFRSRTWD